MGDYYKAPYKHNDGQTITTDSKNEAVLREQVAHIQITAEEAIAADTDGIHAAVTDNGAQQVITTAITNPGYPRNITATAGGTAGDIKAIQVIIEGTNFNDEVITETLPAFTVDTAGTVVGSKAFKTITKITIPAHDGTGATTAIGFGEKLGLPYKLDRNTLIYKHTFLNKVVEGTEPTITTDVDEVDKNTIDLNSSLNGSVVDFELVV